MYLHSFIQAVFPPSIITWTNISDCFNDFTHLCWRPRCLQAPAEEMNTAGLFFSMLPNTRKKNERWGKKIFTALLNLLKEPVRLWGGSPSLHLHHPAHSCYHIHPWMGNSKKSSWLWETTLTSLHSLCCAKTSASPCCALVSNSSYCLLPIKTSMHPIYMVCHLPKLAWTATEYSILYF